ncbi:O-antigen polymerase [Vibrio atlanticus]|nr:O-antigen polymerase [Vibrio atlanticus]
MTLHKKDKILVLILYLIYTLTCLLFIELSSVNDWLLHVNVVIFSSILIQNFILFCFGLRLLSLPIIFLFFSYVFSLSYPVLIYFNVDFGGMSSQVTNLVYGESVFKESVNLAVFSILVMYIGFILTELLNLKEKKLSFLFFNNSFFKRKQNLKVYAVLGCIIFGSVDIYLFKERLILMSSLGYMGVALHEFNFLLVLFSWIFPGFVFLLCYVNKESRIKIVLILLVFLIYKSLQTLTGLRAFTVLQLVVFMIFYNLYISKLKMKSILTLSISIYFALCWFFVVRENRALGITISDFLNIDNYTLGIDILIYSMSEFGVTLNVIAETYQSNIEWYGILGTQVLITFFSAIPFISKISPDLFYLNISEALNLYRYGGSYIADFYYDFGVFCFIPLVFLGMLVSFVDTIMLHAKKRENILTVILLFPFIVQLIFTVRTSTFKIFRTLSWSFILMMIVMLIVILIVSFLKTRVPECKK